MDRIALPGDSINISVITLMEVKGFAFQTMQEEDFVDALCNLFHIIPLNDNIVDEVINIRKKHRIKLPDCIILATAIVNHCSIVTHNTSDFESFASLVNLIDPMVKGTKSGLSRK